MDLFTCPTCSERVPCLKKFFFLLEWEGNGKEIMNIFGEGGKWEGNNEFFGRERETEGKYWEKCQKNAKENGQIMGIM